MSVTTYSSEQIIKALFTANALTRPSNWYVALFTGDPGADGTVNEAADANYARQSATFTASQSGDFWQAVSDAAVTFAAADSAYTVTYIGIFDADSGGNFIASLPLPLARDVPAGGVFNIPAGELVINGENT